MVFRSVLRFCFIEWRLFQWNVMVINNNNYYYFYVFHDFIYLFWCILRLLLSKPSIVIGWFLIMYPWWNSDVSRLGYKWVVVARTPNTTALDQCMTKLKMMWSSAHARISLTFKFCNSRGQETVNFNAGAFSGANVTVDFYNSKWVFIPYWCYKSIILAITFSCTSKHM